MTHPEFLKLHGEFTTKIKLNLATLKDLHESGETDINKYDLKDNISYTDLFTEQSPDIIYMSARDAITTISNLDKKHRTYDKHINTTSIEMYCVVGTNNYDYTVSAVSYRFTYRKLKEDIKQIDIDKAFKSVIKVKLKPKDEQYDRFIDCNLYQLFAEGDLSWGALQRRVYGDGCKV